MLPVMRKNGYLPEMFNDFFGVSCMPQFSETTPKINVVENDKEYRVELGAAGAKKENFSVNLTKDNVLSVKFEQKNESEEGKKEEKYWRKEFSYSKFERNFSLPEDVNKENISAKVENGVLEITLPKAEIKEEEKDKPIMIA
ncbi:MAG: Hsp20/alpha crystallin family protein [Bacteroidales bacterium]|nr:Hsp20/alpha crystallin family protein [Bacteroidales bacterium]